MYVVRLKNTEKVYVIREQKRLSAFIKVSAGTIRNKSTELSWEWGEFVIYNHIQVDLGTRRKGNPYNFVKKYDN
jgi:hypothetical protein